MKIYTFKRILGIGLCICAAGLQAVAQTAFNVRGKVIDRLSRQPVIGAIVRPATLDTLRTVTDTAGVFLLKNVPPGIHAFRVTAAGYAPQETPDYMVSAATPEVNVEMAGTLKDLVTEDDLKNVRELKLTGSLNKADFEVLTGSFSELTKLDLSGVNLTALPSMAFMGATNVAEVILPENLAAINEQDFRNCTSLRSVQLPGGVTMIKENAFGGCTSLAGIRLPANVTEIRSGAFKGCRNLSSFDIPDDSKLTLIGGLDNDGAFQGCVGLTEFSVPKGVTTIGTYAFNGCWALTTLTFANGSALTSIGAYAFYGCSALKDFVFPEGVETIGAYAFYGCATLTQLDLPDKVQRVEEYTFHGCSNLKLLNISNGSALTYMGYYAFYDSGLTLIKIGLTTPPEFLYSSYSSEYQTFDKEIFSRCTVKVPAEALDAYKGNSYWKNFSKITAE